MPDGSPLSTGWVTMVREQVEWYKLYERWNRYSSLQYNPDQYQAGEAAVHFEPVINANW